MSTPVGGYTPILTAPESPAPSALHPPLAGCDPVVLADFAYGKLTHQSSAVEVEGPAPRRPLGVSGGPGDPGGATSGWMVATEAEEAPWWQIDLGAPIYLEHIALWLAPVPEGTTVHVVAHAFHDKAGEPLQGSFRWEAPSEELPVASEGSSVVWIVADTVARFVRVGLRGAGGSPRALLVRGAGILGAQIFAGGLLHSYTRAFTLFADRPLFGARATPGAGPFAVTHRYRDVWMEARSLAAALAAALEPAADRIFLGLCTRNRPEWVVGDLAAVMRGYVVVPLSPEDSRERLGEILERVPLRAVLVEPGLDSRFARLASRCPSLGLVVSVSAAGARVDCDRPRTATREGAEARASAEARCQPEAPLVDTSRCGDSCGGGEPDAAGDGGPARATYAALIARGAELPAPPAAPREESDLYTVLFTSGTSGVPKGAMRSYATFQGMIESYGVAQPAFHLSFQPLSHLSERMYLPAVVLQGGLVGFSGGGAELLSDLRAFEPTVVGSVPRLFEVVHAAHRRRLAEALAAAPDTPREEVEARVFAETRGVFGGRLQAVGVGSAPVGPELLAFLQRCFADLFVSDGYGSTECGTIATSGQIRQGVDVKLVPVPGMETGPEGAPERGEIRVRTPFVIDGYYGDAEASRASVDEEGYFCTGDLGERTADGRVRVVGRVRNVIKLGQGEFVAVDRVEAALAGCPVVDQIFVHPDASSSGLLAVVVPRLDALASLLGRGVNDGALAAHPEAPRAIARALGEHGRRLGLAAFEVPRAVLVEPEPMTSAAGLLTASGKLSRPAAVARYGPKLAALSPDEPAGQGEGSPAARLAAVVGSVVGRRVDPDDPLHEGLGVDSLAVAEVIRAASGVLGREVPLALWFQSRTLGDLVHRLQDGARGPVVAGGALAATDLALDPLPAGVAPPLPVRSPFERVLLTGATGFLGSHLLEALAGRTAAHVVCLVRAPSSEAALARVRRTLARFGIPEPDPARWTAVPGDLGAPDLGLSGADRPALVHEVDAIVHAGAVVSWLLPYEALRAPNVLGTHALLRLATAARTKPLHFVSTVSTAPADGDESSVLPFEQARAGSGYGLSKWVAEHLVRRAMEAGHPGAVYRPAMITGHSRRGIGNPDDYVHRYLRACAAAGRYLDAPDERLDMTPVDFVASGIVALLRARPEGGAVHHLSNLEQSLTYRNLGRAIAASGHPCVPDGYDAFRAGVVQAPGSPLAALAAYFPERRFALHMGPWPCARTRADLAALGVVCPPIDEALIALYLRGLQG